MARRRSLEDRLSRLEKFQYGFVKRSFEPGNFDHAIRWCQRTLGASWINYCTRNLTHFHGMARLPDLDPKKSYLCVSNHRSFFDLYVVTAHLVSAGMPHRLLFPVRANFFYDNPLGLMVNGLMSFFAMYPPVYRERQRQALNLASLDEVVRLLKIGGAFAGLHPEGTRKKDGDPYTLLPAQSGVGRIIHQSRVTVLPVFVNGLTNDFGRQIADNAWRTGEKVVVVFGAPVDFGSLLDEPPSPRIYKQVSERALSVISRLGDEERLIRAAMNA